MKVTLFMAISLNGMIAREDGSEDFLSYKNWETFSGFVEEYKNFIVGSRTYEMVKNWDEDYGFHDFPNATKIVVSNDPEYSLDQGFVLASSPEDALGIMKQRGFEHILLTGGAANNASFAQTGLIDEIIFNINPVVIGSGISLFKPADFQLELELTESKEISGGIVQLKYLVK